MMVTGNGPVQSLWATLSSVYGQLYHYTTAQDTAGQRLVEQAGSGQALWCFGPDLFAVL